MKKLFLLFIVITLFIYNSFSQCDENCKRMEQIKSQKVAFIANKLQLTVEESQQFWPLYNEKSKKSEELDKQEKVVMRNYKKNKETLTNKELEVLSDKLMEIELTSTKLDADYYQKYKKILPVNKILELCVAERQFIHELLKQLKGCNVAKE